MIKLGIIVTDATGKTGSICRCRTVGIRPSCPH
jgi:hypothetical protein